MNAAGGIAVLVLCTISARAAAPDAPPARALTPLSIEEAVGPGPALRIIEVYQHGGSVRMVVQSRQPLVVGRSLFVGPMELPVTIGPLLSEGGGLHYYRATAPGSPRIGPGDVVRFEPLKKPSLPENVLRRLRASYGFEQKAVAEVTAVQDDRLLIDKGTLHEIHERDLFHIYDASGTYKGVLEVRGIGDLQSSGLFEWPRKVPRREVVPGDYAIFLGQRRLFGLGLIAGGRLNRTQVLYESDKTYGGGLLWSMTFHNGWGLEAMFGFYNRFNERENSAERPGGGTARLEFRSDRDAKYIMPIWAKKNFLYPSLVSPFVGAGFYWFQGHNDYESLVGQASGSTLLSVGREISDRHGIFPVFGAGIEFFPARFFRPRIEVRRFIGPTLTAEGNEFQTTSTIFSLGVLTAW